MLVSSIINYIKPVRPLSGPSSQKSLHHTNMQRGGVWLGVRDAWLTEYLSWFREIMGGDRVLDRKLAPYLKP